MDISTELVDGVTVMSCTGRLNMVAAPALRSGVREAVGAGNARVVVDLAETSFIDSSGLGALISGLKETRQAGGDLRIAAAGQQILTVLRLTNLDKVLRPYPEVKDAIDGW